MPIRQDAAGRWHAEASHQRRRLHRRLPAGATARDAKRLEAELIRALHTTAPTRQAVIAGDPTLAELLADYTDRHAATLRSPETARYHAWRIGRWVEGRRASDTRAVVAQIKQDLTPAYAPATLNRSLGTLRKALADAWQRGRTTADYSTLVRRVPEHNARTSHLTLEQVQAIADHASPPVRAGIWLSLFTGCRRGEILALTPDDITSDTITIQAGSTKTLKTRTVPIIAPMRPWLAQVPLGITFEGFKSGFRRARAAAGMPQVQFRDLRRSCGTLMIRQGVPLHIVSKILGHSSTTITERVYAHLHTDQMRAGLETLNGLHQDLHQPKKPARKRAVSR
jgi:integrase